MYSQAADRPKHQNQDYPFNRSEDGLHISVSFPEKLLYTSVDITIRKDQ